MATFNHTDKVKIAASFAHSQGQPPPLEPATENAAQQGTPIPVLDTSDTPKKCGQTTSSSEPPLKVPTSILDDDNQLQGASTVSQHGGSSESTTQNPTVPYLESTRNMIQGTEGTVTKPERSSIPGTPLESSAVSISEHNLPYKPPPHSSVSISGDTPSHQPMPPASRKGLLKDILLECSPPHHFNDELMLSISRGCNNENLRLTKISSEKWKVVENIDFQHDADDMILTVHSKDGSDVAFLKFTANEIYAMVCAEEDTPAEYVFASVEEDNPISVKMTYTICPMNDARGVALGAISDLRNATTSVETLQRLFEETENVDDITEVILLYEKAISSIPPGLDVPPAMSYNLGTSYMHRFERTGDLQDIDRAISSLHSAVELTPGLANLRWVNELGNLYLLRFKRTGDLQDVYHAISWHQRAVEATLSGDADLPSRLNNLGTSYLCRFGRTGNVQDIDYAISYLQSVVESTPPGHANLPSRFNSLGNLYLRCFERIGDLQDIDRAISYQQSAVESTPSGHADLPNRFDNLGTSYLHRFKRTGDLQDVGHAIFHYQNALESTPSGHAELPSRFNSLGNSYSRRFKCTGDLQDIDHAISCLQSAVESTLGHANFGWVNNLGNSYLCRYKHTGDLKDIDHAISHHQTAVQSTPSGHAHLPSCFHNLGTSYACRFERTGNLQDIDHAISHHQTAVQSTPSGHAHLPSRLSSLGTSYARRFKHTGDLQDIEHAISHHQTAVKSIPSGHAHLPKYFGSLGNSYLCRFERTGNLEDIDHAISHHQTAVESAPSGHADLRNCLTNLGTSYACRFKRTGNLQDIDHAISHHQTAVESAPSGHADLPTWFDSLGNSYLCRFEHAGNLEDIDHAISHHQTAVQSTPSGHAHLPGYFSNLGTSYARRFKRTGDLQDIDHAISHHQNALQSTPSGHAYLPSRFNNLGNSYLRRFEHTSDLQDIDHALSHHQNAVESTPSGHADLPSWINNLGNSYLRRFARTGDPQDIDHAIFHYQNALESTPSGHADLPGQFNNLGNSYSRRFKCTGDLQDIDHAISHHQNAVESTPSGHANLPNRFHNLGYSYSYRFEHTNYFPDVQNCVTSYRRAAEANGTPSIRLKSAMLAATLSSVYGDSHCLIDFANAISLLSEIAGLEQTIHRRHANLRDYFYLVASAVATALRFNKADLALEWLEQGRCLVWNQLNQLRTPIDNLRIKNPSLANRFIQAASALESYGTRSILSIPSSHATLAEEIRLQNATRNHTLHATEYTQLLKDIRDLPDFHDFLQPAKASDFLSSLPSEGSVIIFNIHDARCDALALKAGISEPLHIPLENFSLVQAEQLQKTLQFGLLKQREVEVHDRMALRVRLDPSSMLVILNELWCKVVQPILKALGYSSPPNPSDRSRIWWCPTGPLAFLPLHAAGVYGSAYQRGSCISDFMVSSYIPTIRSLNDKFIASSTSSKCTSLVLISQPNTPGLSSIPSTRTETHALEALMKGTAVDALLLEDSKATREKVKAEMKSRSWAHFACHGVQDVDQPLESGLCLHDGRLELLEIMKEEIPNLDLAFLSACQTSKGDVKLSEEVVHLAAGMLAAGYRGVVGTMWSISDKHGPAFATEFYEYLLSEKGLDGLDSTRAAYALDYATRKVRERLGEDDTAFLTWVPYVHFGY